MSYYNTHPMNPRFTRFIVIWLLVLVSLWIGDRFIRGWLLTGYEPRAITPRAALTQAEQSTVELFETLAPSVVYIVTETRTRSFWGAGPSRLGTGSGFIWDSAGHVVTNHHVVAGAQQVFVRVNNSETVAARLVGTAPDYDLAVLKLVGGRSRLQPIPIGTSKDLKVGQAAFAIGNPFGLARSLTTGVISALNRRLPTAPSQELRGLIQTDAAINPGNSGGPLLDSAGRLIGVNTAILSESGSSAGVGFAVPVDVVNRVVPQLVAMGRVERPGIGITALPEEMAASLGVTGVIIEQVLPGSSAQAAGLTGIDRARRRLGDIITHVDGRPVASVADMAEVLQEVGVGNEVALTVVRNGRSRQVVLRVMDIA